MWILFGAWLIGGDRDVWCTLQAGPKWPLSFLRMAGAWAECTSWRALASEGLGPNGVAYSELMGMPLPTRPVSFVMLILEGPGGGIMQATRAMLKLKVVSVVAPPYTIR